MKLKAESRSAVYLLMIGGGSKLPGAVGRSGVVSDVELRELYKSCDCRSC